MSARTVVITGSSSGIGLATAVAFAKAGDTVLATMRDPARSGALMQAAAEAGVSVEVLPLDVTIDASVASCVEEIVTRHGPIDVLINNAGAVQRGTLDDLTIDDLRTAMELNFFGVVRTTKAVLPSMQAAGAGHLIAVSSVAGVIGQPFNDAYCAAKHAVEGLYESLFPVANALGVHVSIVEPGPVKGDFTAHGTDVDEPKLAQVADLRARFDKAMTGGRDVAQTNEEVADAILAVADDPNPRLRYQTGRFVERLLGLKLADLTGERVTGLTGSWLA